MALHKSTDGGGSWTTYTITTAYSTGQAVAIDPNNDNTIYAGGTYTGTTGENGCLFKTLDGGNSWTDISIVQSGPINAIAVDPSSPDTLYVGTPRGVYKSEDSGLSWIQISYFDVKFIKLNPILPSEIFASGYDGAYQSNDNGVSWLPLESGCVLDRITCSDLDLTNSIFYAGNAYGSIYRNRLAELYICALKVKGEGTTEPLSQGYILDLDTNLTVEATADTDWAFNRWSGDVPQGQEAENPLSLTIDSDKEVTANFIQIRCKLSLDTSDGGTTNPAPGDYKYDTGTEVIIQATPEADYEFTTWIGDVSSGQEKQNPLTLIMDSDKYITASFRSTLVVDGKKFPCFIATAACGSPYHFYVKVLRDFRDTFLTSSPLGQELVDLYYKHSPPWADLISKHRVLRIIVRINLLPLVILSFSMLYLGPLPTFFILLLMLILPIRASLLYQKKQKLPNQG